MIKYYSIDPDQKAIKPASAQREEFENPSVARIISFDMLPIAQQRPRTRVIQPKGGGKAYAQIYTVNSKHKKNLLKLLVKSPIIEQATFFYCLALYKPPRSWSTAKKERSYGTRKVTKPDGTNIAKFYEDLLEGIFMPKDQYMNPTMPERYYSTKNQVIVATIVSDQLTYNLPKKIKEYFLGLQILK